MTTTRCWPPIVRVLHRNGFNAFVKKDNKVLTLLQTCEYLPWILVSLFAQRHTKTIPVAFQTSKRRLACSHQQLGFQSSEKEKKNHDTPTITRNTSDHVTSVTEFRLNLALQRTENDRYYLMNSLPIGPTQTKTGDSSHSYWRSEHVHYASFFESRDLRERAKWNKRRAILVTELEHFDFSLSGFQQKSACDLHTVISTIFPWKPKRTPLLPLLILRKVKRV